MRSAIVSIVQLSHPLYETSRQNHLPALPKFPLLPPSRQKLRLSSPAQMDIDFSDILEKSRAVRSKQQPLTAHPPIPPLARTLPQISRESLPPISQAPSSTNAVRLLSEYGFETDRIERTLQDVALLDAFEPYTQPQDTDIKSFLNMQREMLVLQTVNQVVSDISERSIKRARDVADENWERIKADHVALNSAAYRPTRPARMSDASSRTSFAGAFASPFRHPRPGRRSSLPADAMGTAPIYESVVRRAVHSRANATSSIPIATELDDLLISNLAPRGDPMAAGKTVQHLHGVYNGLRFMTGEVDGDVSEGCWGGMRDGEGRRRVLKGGLRFLCVQFREDKMRREIELRPVEARRGGVPGLRADVRAYCNLVFERGVPDVLASSLCDGMPVWAQVYYCLRAGYPGVALEVVADALGQGVSNASLRLFKECLEAVSGGCEILPTTLLERLVQDYGLVAKRGDDPYMRVCYVIVARLDPAAGDKMALLDTDYGLLFYSIEDYLWLRLSVARMPGDERLPESLRTYELGMKSVRDEVCSFGASHFDPRGETPTFYAFVLMLTGQFAQAISYLDKTARALAEATHVAFILYYYGIVRESMGEMVGSEDEDECYMIEYADLLWRYVSRFSRTDPTAAAVYLFTLREAPVRNELLKKLVLQTKQFDLLLGTKGGAYGRGAGAERQVGVLEELWPLSGRDASPGESLLEVVESAAETAERTGDRESALMLYDVAGSRGKVVAIHVDRLSAVLTSRDSPTREKAFAEALRYRQTLDARAAVGNMPDALLGGLLPSFDLLLSMGEFFDLVWEKKLDEGRELLERLSFLPSSDSELVSKVQELRVGGGVWADAVCDRVPDILLGAMEMLCALHERSRREGVTSTSLKRFGKTLVNFSGMMHISSADISARLVRLGVMMS